MKLLIDDNIKTQIKMYTSSEVEVGGFIFGEMGKDSLIIKHITLKRGMKSRITFKPDEYSLLISNHKFLGTWHTHLTYCTPLPSQQDLKSLQKFDKDKMHLIFNLEGEFVCFGY